MSLNPEISKSISTGNIKTNYHEYGSGDDVLLLHGSGPGVSAWANWRFNIEALAETLHVLAPDIVGFGFTERQEHFEYSLQKWVDHTLEFMDAKFIDKTSVVGNSFGGALALALAIRAPDRVDKLVLMGAAGVDFKLTSGLDKTWGYVPSVEAMAELLDLFAYNKTLIGEDLAALRYEASIRPGFQESFKSMFPAPRQNGINVLRSRDEDIKKIDHSTLIVHGYDDQIIPVENAFKLLSLIPRSQMHIFRECGHWTQIEYKNQFNKMVADFLGTG